MSTTTNKQALRIPERKKYNWGQAVMHTCDFCDQYAMTITTKDGEHSCASCCDAEYATALTCALEIAIDRAEAAERRIAELEARPANPINFKENVDADYCRGWASAPSSISFATVASWL